MIQAYAGQNQISGIHAKKSGVIFFQPKLLAPKHSGMDMHLRLIEVYYQVGTLGYN